GFHHSRLGPRRLIVAERGEENAACAVLIGPDLRLTLARTPRFDRAHGVGQDPDRRIECQPMIQFVVSRETRTFVPEVDLELTAARVADLIGLPGGADHTRKRGPSRSRSGAPFSIARLHAEEFAVGRLVKRDEAVA